MTLIVAEQKTIDEIIKSLEGFKRVVIASCGTCVTVCMAGGEEEALVIKNLLSLNAKEKKEDSTFKVVNCKRQCDREFLDDLAGELEDGDVILSLACGVGVQFMSEIFSDKLVLPGLNTKFYGAARELGYWTEYCQGCGNCLLEKTGGICPIARCSKSNFNGPCGGSQNGVCEINNDIDCAWQLIYDRLKKFDRVSKLKDIYDLRDWRTSRDGGPRSVRRIDMSVED